MKAEFDIAAQTYDHDFTHSNIGKLQRKKVWEYLDQVLQGKRNLRILELNCGTGEDAWLFSQRGHRVTATDISENMLAVAKQKDETKGNTYVQLDLNEINSFQVTEKFDLVFSNFGGLNCIDGEAVKNLAKRLNFLLSEHGKFIAVVMPSFCFWETFYFMLKGKMKEAFRRRKEYVMANVSGTKVKTWYYSPKEFSTLIGVVAKREKTRPIGLFVPPSYLEGFFSKRKSLLNLLDRMEDLFAFFSWQAGMADHYYIEYKLR